MLPSIKLATLELKTMDSAISRQSTAWVWQIVFRNHGNAMATLTLARCRQTNGQCSTGVGSVRGMKYACVSQSRQTALRLARDWLGQRDALVKHCHRQSPSAACKREREQHHVMSRCGDSAARRPSSPSIRIDALDKMEWCAQPPQWGDGLASSWMDLKDT